MNNTISPDFGSMNNNWKVKKVKIPEWQIKQDKGHVKKLAILVIVGVHYR